MAAKKSLAINLNSSYPNIMNITDDFNTQPQSDEYATEHEEVRGTFAAEPANEDNLTPEQAFDILFGYAEERHSNDPCAHTKNLQPII